MNIYLDTSVLMHSTTRLEKLIEEGNKLVVCTLVLEELDNHKDGKDGEKAFKARTAIKFLKKYENQIEFITSDGYQAETIKRYELDPNKPDNKIL